MTFLKLLISLWNIFFYAQSNSCSAFVCFCYSKIVAFRKMFHTIFVGKLFSGNLFEIFSTTSLLTASINISTVLWFFGFSILVLLWILGSLVAVACFCSFLLQKNAFNLIFLFKVSIFFFNILLLQCPGLGQKFKDKINLLQLYAY